jgi:hypothetical protein
MHQAEEIPIACDLTVFTAAERAAHLARTAALFAAVRAVTEEADGFTFAFAMAPARRVEVGHWAAAEQRCCPFFRFELRDADAGRTLLLRVSGPVAGKEILRAAMQAHGGQ